MDSSSLIRPRFYIFIHIFFLSLWIILCLLKYFSFHTSFFDLGVFDHNLYAISHFGDYKWLFLGHFQPSLLFYAAIYKIAPYPIVLLILQAIFITLGGIILDKIVKQTNQTQNLKLPRSLVILSYYLYFGVWYNVVFDFHTDHLAIPIMFTIFYVLQADKVIFLKKWVILPILIVILCLIKEPFILSASAFGIYFIIKYKKFLLGAIITISSVLFFYTVTHKLMPAYSSGLRGALDASAFSYMGNSLQEIFFYLLTHFLDIIEDIFVNYHKFVYFISLFGPFAFCCFLSPLELIPALPILTISFVSRLPNYYSVMSHYSAGVIAPLTIAFFYSLPRLYKLLSKIRMSKRAINCLLLMCMLLFHILVSPSPISLTFWVRKCVWPYYHTAYFPSGRDIEIWRAIKNYIPHDVNIKVSYQNFVNCGHLAQRKKIFVYPQGLDKTDYVVIDLKRPYFSGICENNEYDKILQQNHWETFKKMQSDDKWMVVYSNKDGFYIFKRKTKI